jgi:FAD/FMN-containing dehydrogenase
MIIGFEGDSDIVTAEDDCARRTLAQQGGRDLGEEPGQHWLRHRYDVSFKMSRAFRAGAFTDTIEVATAWDRVLPLYREVRAAVAPYALCMAHFSHAYTDGCSIYFTLIGRRRAAFDLTDSENRSAVAEDQALYDKLWRAAMQATLRAGATISHHHGVGRLKAPFMAAEHGASLRILSALRSACDPQHVCNPGNLAPEVPPSAQQASAPPSSTNALEPIQIHRHNCLVDAEVTVRLHEIERALQAEGLSLGSLPPRAWGRTLGEALSQPRPSEASLLAGRLRDRRVRLRALLADGEELIVPPHLAPRRATGPDLGYAFLGEKSDLVTLRQATLRLVPQASEALWAGYFFKQAEPAVRALFQARAVHCAVGMSEIVLCDRALFAKVLGAQAEAQLPQAEAGFALLVQPSGPEVVGRATMKTFEAQLDKSTFSPISATLCRDFWTPAALFQASASAESVAAFAEAFPSAERSISLADCTADGVTALLAEAGPERLLCGVYLHGLTLCTTAPIARSSADKSAAQIGEDAQARLWPRLVAAMRRG